MSSFFEKSQNDVVGILLADDYFSDILVVAVRSLEADNAAAAAVAGTKLKNGKAGVAVRVLMPTLRKHSQETISQLRSRIIVRVVENPTINNGSIGVGKSAEEVMSKVYDLLDRMKLGWTAHEFKADTDEVQAIIEGGNLQYDQAFYTFVPTGGLSPVAFPHITLLTSTVTMTCATSGAAIYYTTDGATFPSAANSATLYAGAFTKPAVGTVIRACAFKTGMRQSHANNETVT